ncbi:MAG TPA: class I SAM-dependent methyltransferase [Acidimicrobiia bacterium]|nr:class I SAM-dependent methyltransferase [Acidimicrobiia bacterium]
MTVNLWADSAHARDYLERRRHIPHRDEGYAALLEFLPPAPRRILDLGTGDGYLFALIRDHHPDVTGVAADFSAEMLERARDGFADTAVDVVEHNLDAPLPASWGKFDVIVSAFAIHHVADDRKHTLYREVYDRLTPGGLFANLEHVASATPELHEAFLYAIGSSPEQDDPSNQLAGVGEQLAWLRGHGFEQVDCHWKWRELALLAGTRAA